MKEGDPELLALRLKNLESGRGKRPKLDNPSVTMRMSIDTREKLEAIAWSYDCAYNGKPQLSGLFSMIANGELLVVPAPNYELE